MVGLAAVFAGLTVLLVVVALAKQPFLLALALPFGATTYFLWYHASGRLADRARTVPRGERERGPRFGSEPGAGARFRGGADRREEFDPRSRVAGEEARGRGGRRSARPPPSLAAAYRTLDLEPGASEEAVRRAYRAKVKRVHPDTDTGDEERFKAVNRAYERLTE